MNPNLKPATNPHLVQLAEVLQPTIQPFDGSAPVVDGLPLRGLFGSGDGLLIYLEQVYYLPMADITPEQFPPISGFEEVAEVMRYAILCYVSPAA